MSNEAMPQYVQIEQPFGCEPPVVHCPICGGATRAIEEGGKVTPCAHLAFIYSFEDFEYKSQEFEKKMEGIDDDLMEDLTFDTFKEFLQKAGYDNKLLAIEITYGGMGGGPMSFTDVYGFDYGTLAGNDES